MTPQERAAQLAEQSEKRSARLLADADDYAKSSIAELRMAASSIRVKGEGEALIATALRAYAASLKPTTMNDAIRERYEAVTARIKELVLSGHRSDDIDPACGQCRELSALQVERRSLIVQHDYPKLREFFDKHAIGPKAMPSCIVCGKEPETVAIMHAELPGIVVCKSCRDRATSEAPKPNDGLPRELREALDHLAALDDLCTGDSVELRKMSLSDELRARAADVLNTYRELRRLESAIEAPTPAPSKGQTDTGTALPEELVRLTKEREEARDLARQLHNDLCTIGIHEAFVGGKLPPAMLRNVQGQRTRLPWEVASVPAAPTPESPAHE